MSDVGQIERNTQNRIVKLFQEQLDYDYLGNWEERENNSNLETELLLRYLNRQYYSQPLVDKAIFELERAAQSQADSLYNNNKTVYKLLRYGTDVRASQGENKQTVHFIDWEQPLNNDFAIA